MVSAQWPSPTQDCGCCVWIQVVWCCAGNGAAQHVLCVSPYPHYRKDRPTNPCLYWINSYNGDKQFNVATASGAALSQHGASLFTRPGLLCMAIISFMASCGARWMLGPGVDCLVMY